MKQKSIIKGCTVLSSLLFGLLGQTEIKAHSTLHDPLHTGPHTVTTSSFVYDQAPYYELPSNIQLPPRLTNTGDNQWVSFPAGEANQFQIVTLPANQNVTKPVIGGGTVTETNLLGTDITGFDEVLNDQFPPNSSRVPIIETITTQNHSITPYTFSPATVPNQTGPQPHVHWYDAEWFYVTEGELDLWFGTPGAYGDGEIPGVNAPLEDTYYYVHLTAGQMVYTPAGTLHSFQNNYGTRAEMLSIWYRQDNPKDGSTAPEGGIEQFFTHPEIGVMFDSPDESEDFVSNLSGDDTAKRIANWNELFPLYSVIMSSEFQEYLEGSNNGTTNNATDPNPNESVQFDYDPALLGSNADFLNSLWYGTPEIVIPESSNLLGIIAIGGLAFFIGMKKK